MGSNNYSNQSSNATQKNNYSNQCDCNPCDCDKYNVEPLPESSRPRRDGPGGEDAQ